MKCAVPKCQGSLKVSHTYQSAVEKFQRAECSECGTVHALVTTPTVVTERGGGARAMAARARSSETS